MTHFRDLLKNDTSSTPSEEQRRASEGLADAVERSHLRWWRNREAEPEQGIWLLLAVAPYSQYDLTLLDLLDERLHSESLSLPVYVVNLQDYDSLEQIAVDFPGAGQVHQTPLAALCEPGLPPKVAWGKKARDMTALALGLSPENLSLRIMSESPSYANSVEVRTPAPP